MMITRLLTVLLCCLLVSGCAQVGVMYNLPRVSDDGQEVYAVKTEGEAYAANGNEPAPSTATRFPAERVIAIDLLTGDERTVDDTRELDWYHAVTAGQWRYAPDTPPELAESNRQAEAAFDGILKDMPSRRMADDIAQSGPFPSRNHDWPYRSFDISPDGRLLVVEDQGSLVLYDLPAEYAETLAHYRRPGSPGWMERNSGPLIVGAVIVGIVVALILTADSKSSRRHDHGHHRFH